MNFWESLLTLTLVDLADCLQSCIQLVLAFQQFSSRFKVVDIPYISSNHFQQVIRVPDHVLSPCN